MNEGTLVIKKSFEAPAQKVFDAWITPETLKEWYGPEGFTNDIHSMEVKEGGAYRLTMNGPDGPHTLRGVFKTIDAPKKLVFTWQWEGGDGGQDGPETLVTVEFSENGGTTDMILTHNLPDKKSRDMHEMGWTSSFDKLAKVVA